MKKIIYSGNNNQINIVVPIEKRIIERDLGCELTDAQYESLVISKSVPENVPYRFIEDDDIPGSREFRDAWEDVTELSSIDINCEKARDLKLSQMRQKRNKMLDDLDKTLLAAIDAGNNSLVESIRTERQRLRDITGPLKGLNVAGKINDQGLLDKIVEYSKLEQ